MAGTLTALVTGRFDLPNIFLRIRHYEKVLRVGGLAFCRNQYIHFNRMSALQWCFICDGIFHPDVLLQLRWGPSCRPIFVPVVALLDVFDLSISRLLMGNLVRILVAILILMRIMVIFPLVVILFSMQHL